MFDCEECGMPYGSPLAAAECAEMDRAEEARLQRALRGVRTHSCPHQVPDDDG